WKHLVKYMTYYILLLLKMIEDLKILIQLNYRENLEIPEKLKEYHTR
ncbi:MAG: hypothetical protein QG591_1180, partial [Planctomycetota bacterium]|nr:hypothetical protein [Planctomycetota bacterium]